ncbi:MAG: hypothetical protein OHK0039_12030 [Bacteroidia bacterium]
MKKLGLILCLFLSAASLQAQEEESTLSITGSVDLYYKYDFSGTGNIGTSFGNEQNSLSIGMIDLLFEKAAGKASFVGEISFGPRSRSSVGPGSLLGTVGEGDGAFDVVDYVPNIQNLYVSYAFTDKFSMTAGYMGTFVGYEVISPTGNFNYSTSYLFTNGPFQNAGVKAEYAFNDRLALMVGAFNQWNVYTADPDLGLSEIGAQLYVSPIEGWDAYINFITGQGNGTELDLTTTYQLTDAFLVGLNAATYSQTSLGADSVGTFWGVAGYLNYAVTDWAALGVRFEHFNANAIQGILSSDEDAAVNALTISANLGTDGLVFIPEFRLDAASTDIFVDAEGAATKTAAQILFGVVYAF